MSSPNRTTVIQIVKKLSPLQKLLLGLISLPAFGFLALIIFYMIVLSGAFGKLPTEAQIQKYKHPEASEIYSADGVLLGKYFRENRTNVAFDQISPHIVHALLATEDARFYEHSGVDPRSMMRVIFKTFLLGKRGEGGGSTISQQLAKNLYKRQRHSFLTMPVNKFKEMIIASRLESMYEKDKIIEFYLNTVPFGEGVFGIDAASKRFFGKEAKDIAPEEGAMLIGLLKATTAYNPKRNPERAKKRRNLVLSRMAINNYPDKGYYLSESEVKKLQSKKIKLSYQKFTHNEGLATYLREHLRMELKKIFKEENLDYNLYTDGLKIHTTVNSKMQQYAEESMREHLKGLQKEFDEHWKGRNVWGNESGVLTDGKRRSYRYRRLKERGFTKREIDKIFNRKTNMTVFHWDGEKDTTMSPLDSIKYYAKFLHGGFMAMDPKSGDVLAWVGGIDHKYFKYNHVTSRRQVGSTFKPIVYATALENGYYPCDYIANDSIVYEDYQNWTPRNSDGKYGGFYSMPGALKNSVNTASAWLIVNIAGIDTTVELAKNMGITSDLPLVPSICLGTPDISLLEMVGAYCTFPNDGKKTTPIYVTRIEDENGRTIKKFRNSSISEQILSKKTARTMVHMMQKVIDGGSGGRVRYKYKVEGQMGGKTGTTQSHADGWFIGYSPSIAAGAWVGAEDRRVHFRSIRQGQGAHMALPIWAKFFKKVYADKDFAKYKNAKFGTISTEVWESMECEDFVEDTWDVYEGGEDPNEILYYLDGKPVRRRDLNKPENQPGFMEGDDQITEEETIIDNNTTPNGRITPTPQPPRKNKPDKPKRIIVGGKKKERKQKENIFDKIFKKRNQGD